MARAFKIGEKVRFLHEKQEGVVQRLLGKNMLEVLVDDFLEIEVGVDEVVPIHAAEEILRNPHQEEAPPAKVQVPLVDLKRPPSLILFRNDSRDYELWLLNPGGTEVHFTAFLKVRHKFKGLNSGACLPRDRYFIGKLNSQDFHNTQQVFIQLLQYPLGEFVKPIPPYSIEIHTRTEIFEKRPDTIPEFGVEGYEFVLEEKNEVAEAISEFDMSQSNFRIRQRKAKAPRVVDLHIEKLIDNPASIDAHAMLRIQLEHFERSISDVQLSQASSVVFIHGVGTGKLKREMQDRLRNYDFVSRFEAADPVKYGNGATVVFFS